MFYTFLLSEPLSKERVEAFSDGVYAIVATLLILDIWLVPKIQLTRIRVSIVRFQMLLYGMSKKIETQLWSL